MGGLIRFSPYLVGLALIAGGMWWSYTQGIAKCQADHNAERLARIEAGQKVEKARRDLAIERDELRDQLEVQANADAVSEHQCFGPSRALRLNANR